MHKKHKEDLEFGLNEENKVYNYLKKFYPNLQRSKKKNDIYDFYDDTQKLYIELKSRRCCKATYDSTMFPLNKIKWADQKIDQYKFIFLFNFYDGLYKFDYTGDDTSYSLRNGGRRDRGINEYKVYSYIPTKFLQKI